MGHKDFRSNLCEDTDLKEIIAKPNKKQSHEALAFLRQVTVKRFTEHPSTPHRKIGMFSRMFKLALSITRELAELKSCTEIGLPKFCIWGPLMLNPGYYT